MILNKSRDVKTVFANETIGYDIYVCVCTVNSPLTLCSFADIRTAVRVPVQTPRNGRTMSERMPRTKSSTLAQNKTAGGKKSAQHRNTSRTTRPERRSERISRHFVRCVACGVWRVTCVAFDGRQAARYSHAIGRDWRNLQGGRATIARDAAPVGARRPGISGRAPGKRPHTIERATLSYWTRLYLYVSLERA